MHAYPEFDSLYRLLGIEPPTSHGTRKLAGWKAAPDVQVPAAPEEPAERGPVIDRQAVRRAKVWLLGLPTALAALLVAGVFFAIFLVAIGMYVFGG